jgi:predicted N-formylglutamate amidohydrolase
VHDDQSLLAPDEPAAFRVEREDGRSSFFLTCDHAGALVPRKLNSLGVSTEDLRRHIAWDIGAAAVAVDIGQAPGSALQEPPHLEQIATAARLM